jgi:hypothetical protein
MITCSKCRETLPLESFEFRKDSNTYRKTCRKCRNQRKRRANLSPDRLKKVRERDNESHKQRRRNFGESVRKKERDWYKKNKSEVLTRNATWRRENWEKVYNQRMESGSYRRGKRKWYHRKGKNNLQFVISERLRGRLRAALKNQGISSEKRAESALNLVGCSIEELKAYIEEQFTEGMSWENYGEWHIDHIRPCASFDMSNEVEQKECFHFLNLQPLWASENLRKGSRFSESD